MKYFIKIAANSTEKQQAHHLLEANYHQNGYIKGSLKQIDTDNEVQLLCFNEEKQLLGVATIIYLKKETDYLPSETDFNFDAQNLIGHRISRKNIVELKRVAKSPYWNHKGRDLFFLSVLLAFHEYMHLHNLKGFITTLKPYLLTMLEKIGLKMIVLDAEPQLPYCLTYLNGNYFTDKENLPRAIIGYRDDLTQALLKYTKFTENQTISINLSNCTIINQEFTYAS